MKPRVDVIVPCFNYGKLLEACVTSVVSQDGVAIRVLVMDDASTDETEVVGRRLAAADPRVEYYRHANNQGHIATYNEALAMLTGDYCMILSADDLLTPRALARATGLMDAHPEVGLVYGRDIPFRDTPPLDSPRSAPGVWRLAGYLQFLTAACDLGHTGIQAPTALVRTTLHRAIGGYLPELPHSGDTEIWLRMAAYAQVGELDADQAFRRLHTANMSLNFSPLGRLAEQKRAFDTHFRSQEPLRPAVAALQAVVHRTIAQSAFWSAAQAFDRGDTSTCEECLAFASTAFPEIQSSVPWRRLQWKRRLGPSACRVIGPLATRMRRLVRPFAHAAS